ncbi:MAG: metallophosphoesterase [Polyangiaceae bacterium]
MPQRPLPRAQRRYADATSAAQSLPLPRLVDHLQYPTLGAPALVEVAATLQCVVSLDEGVGPSEVTLALVARHGDGGRHGLRFEAEALDDGVEGGRRLYELRASLEGIPAALYDLALEGLAEPEVQPNAVRVFEQITGDELVVFCGDSQLHDGNTQCLERFVARMNDADNEEVAWIALIGDVCDNGVKGETNAMRLALKAKASEVSHYYDFEYPTAHRILAKLHKPILLMPGNHDGMVAYARYGAGERTNVVVGPDPKNDVAYDGLQHFARTFGPLHHAFDWGGTRYLCTNTYELNRHDRLGFHCVVTNWGGWMQDSQIAWLDAELADAHASGLGAVVLMHHDPRGGSLGRKLGQYHLFRPYDFDEVGAAVLAYLRYLAKRRNVTFQQEWMADFGVDLVDHPARRILESLAKHHVHAVVMGHDNLNWVDTYDEGDDLLSAPSSTTRKALFDDDRELGSPEIEALRELLEKGAMEEALAILDGLPPERRDALLAQALPDAGDARVVTAASDDEATSEAGKPVFDLSDRVDYAVLAEAPLHFVHVDDIGAYRHSEETDFDDYGYVKARLSGGKPVYLEGVTMRGAESASVDLIVEE